LVHREHVKQVTGHLNPRPCTQAAAINTVRTIFGVLGKTLLAKRSK